MAFSNYTQTTKKATGFANYAGNTNRSSTGFSSYAPKTNARELDSSQGLYNVAVKSGLQRDADRIMKAQAGEETKKIFSGGIISDVFDGLNALQYGVTGLLKGKSFSEGVKTRQSFTDKDALGDSGLGGIILGTALDILVDPLTWIAPATVLKKIPILSKALKGAKELTFGKMVEKGIQGTDKTYQALEGGTKLGKYLGSKFTWMFGADPIYKETFERSVKNTAITTQAVVDLGKSVSKLAPETASKILKKDATGRFVRTSIKELEKVLKPEEIIPVAKLYTKLDNLGKEAVDLGLLSKEKYEEGIGEYIKNAYSEYELAKGKGLFPSKKVGISEIKIRKDAYGITYQPSQFEKSITKKFKTKEERDLFAKTLGSETRVLEKFSPIPLKKLKELGQIDNPAYLLFKSIFDLNKSVENAKLLKTLNKNFGTDVAQEGFTKIATGSKWGDLSGKYVPDNVAQYLNEIIEPAKDTFAKDLVGNFKFFKVVMNPATHARNIVSNQVLNYWKLGMNPLDPRTWKANATAMSEIFKKGGKWSEEAKPLGYNLDTFASAEMKTLLDSPEVELWGKGKKAWASAKEKLGNIYQQEENVAKLSAYIYNRTTKGLNPEEAWKAAESATFNYAQVTPFIRKLRESIFGFPFITFTAKATPLALETAYKAPGRISVIGKIKNNIEKLANVEETEKERALEPAWVKDGFYVKLPIKDKEGRSAYFDLTYILPFGDIVSGNFFERGTSRETGLPESSINAVANNSPFIQTVSAIAKNQDFYGNQIWKESDNSAKQLKDLMIYITKTYVPPMVGDQLPGGYNEKGERQWRGIYGSTQATDENQKRNLQQELLRQVGAKIQPIDADIQETFVEWNKKKALQSLLKEKGVGQYFQSFYIPKND